MLLLSINSNVSAQFLYGFGFFLLFSPLSLFYHRSVPQMVGKELSTAMNIYRPVKFDGNIHSQKKHKRWLIRKLTPLVMMMMLWIYRPHRHIIHRTPIIQVIIAFAEEPSNAANNAFSGAIKKRNHSLNQKNGENAYKYLNLLFQNLQRFLPPHGQQQLR